jgi:hypothetical protein
MNHRRHFSEGANGGRIVANLEVQIGKARQMAKAILLFA